MRDVGKPNFPEAFEGEIEIVQGIRNIVFALEEEYSDLTIPKGFSSPINKFTQTPTLNT